MPTCRQNDVISASRCRHIDFSMLHLHISFIFVTINKKTCQYLYFKMLLYISQNAAMWTKLRHCGILLSSH